MIKTFIFAALLVISASTQALEFVGIEDDEAIRANNGTIEFQVEASKPYLLSIDDVIVDGGDIGTNTHTLENVDRGTHVIDVRGFGELKKVTVHVLRVHK